MLETTNQKITLIGICLLAFTLAGCASGGKTSPGDPYESTNRKIYNFNDSIDRNFFQPLARGYVNVTPDPVRSGVTNFFSNVGYLNVMANDLLQGKFEQFARDTSRFFVNSTIGLGGLFDPATGVGLEAQNEDFGQTLGVWGAGEGAYLNLPLAGPSSFRDAPGFVTAMALNPFTYMNPIITIPTGFIGAVNARANLLEATSIRDQAALDPYTFVREAYRQQREFLIHDGNPPGDDFDDYIEGDADAAILKIY